MVLVIAILSFLTVFLLFLGAFGPVKDAYRTAMLLPGGSNNFFANTFLRPFVNWLTPLNERTWADALREKLEKKLVLAGRPGGQISGAQYLALAQLAGIAGFILVMGLFALGGGASIMAIFISLIVAAVIYWLGLEYLGNLVTSRQKEITRQFPHFLDLSVMTMEAGSSLLETIDLYVTDNKKDALAEELDTLVGELNMGATLQDALMHLNDRVASDQVQNTIKAVIQGLEMGTPIGKILRDQADGMRFHRTQMAERAAEELKVKIMGPVILMMISIFILIIGPAFLEVMSSGVF